LPSPVSINAVRLRTPDGRYLQAANGGGGLLIAASVAAANTWETFLFAPPAAWPLGSGSLVSLDVCNANWDPAGLRVRVEHNTVTLPHGHKDDRLVTYEVGGAGTRVLVCGPFSAGYPAYPGDDPAERVFTLVKLVGGAPAPAGTPINIAHIHTGGSGVAGAVLISTNLAAGEVVLTTGSGSFTKNVSGLDPAVVQNIINNPAGFYFNVHSTLNPGGVARGQLVKVS